MEEFAGARIVVSGGMPGAVEPVLVDDQSLEANRTASMGLVGADADLRPEAEAKAIGKAGRGIVKNAR